MDFYHSFQYFARMKNKAQAQMDELNKDYWQQDAAERERRTAEKNSAVWELAYSGGALSVLLDQHEEKSELHAPFEDRLGETDVLEAVYRADNGNAEYWEYIKNGGLLSLRKWLDACEERATLCAIPDDVELSKEQWGRLHNLDLVLGY